MYYPTFLLHKIQLLTKLYLTQHGKNKFAEVSKDLARYRYKNHFIELSK